MDETNTTIAGQALTGTRVRVGSDVSYHTANSATPGAKPAPKSAFDVTPSNNKTPSSRLAKDGVFSIFPRTLPREELLLTF